MDASTSRIIADPAVMVGKPVVRGTRLSVAFVLDLLNAGWTVADIKAEYPSLRPDDVLACFRYARDVVASKTVGPTAASWGATQPSRRNS